MTEEDLLDGRQQLDILLKRAARRQTELTALMQVMPLKDPDAQAAYQQLIQEIDWHEEVARALHAVVSLDQAALAQAVANTIVALERELQMLHRAQRDLVGEPQREVLSQIEEIQEELKELRTKAARYGG